MRGIISEVVIILGTFILFFLESMKYRYQDTTEHEIISVIKVWLVKAKERAKKIRGADNVEVFIK